MPEQIRFNDHSKHIPVLTTHFSLTEILATRGLRKEMEKLW